jgi:hypothetical protein
LTIALARAAEAQEMARAVADVHAALMRSFETTLAQNRAVRARARSVRIRTRR